MICEMQEQMFLKAGNQICLRLSGTKCPKNLEPNFLPRIGPDAPAA